ncbi:surfeit locus protein 5 subunit 22 of mediator complex-domain-containing protein, partial [Entophlyctis helioformis]
MNAAAPATSTATTATATATSDTHDALLRRVDTHIEGLLSNLSLVLSAAALAPPALQQRRQRPGAPASAAASQTSGPASAAQEPHKIKTAHDALVAEAATANMARAVETLLGLTTELKQTLILNDFAALNAQMLARHQTLSNQTRISRQTLAEMRSDLAAVELQLFEALHSPLA